MADEPAGLRDVLLDRALAILAFVAEQTKALPADEISSALALPFPLGHRPGGGSRRWAAPG